jgi:hypothetical protein
VLKSSLVRFDHNRYSVEVKAARRTAQLRVYAEGVVVWCDGEIVSEHPRRFGRGQTPTIPGITCRCWPGSPARSGTATVPQLGPSDLPPALA